MNLVKAEGGDSLDRESWGGALKTGASSVLVPFQGIKKPCRFFDAKEEASACLKFSGISGRHTDLWHDFFHQCAH
jgi:hypothetical protein